jgi:hypothetical protein
MPAFIPVTYSGLDTSATFAHPLIPDIIISGIAGQGLNQATVRMATDHSVLKVGMDGAVIISYVPGEQGEVELQVWQTSSIHFELLAWYNACTTAAQNGNVGQWAAGTLVIQNTVTGTSHTCTGVCPMKVPDVPYQTEAQTINWVLRAANIINE